MSIPLLFSIKISIKREGSKTKMKLDFLSIFDIPLSECFIVKRVLSLQWAPSSPPPQKKKSVFSLVVLFDDQITFVN